MDENLLVMSGRMRRVSNPITATRTDIAEAPHLMTRRTVAFPKFIDSLIMVFWVIFYWLLSGGNALSSWHDQDHHHHNMIIWHHAENIPPVGSGFCVGVM
jgi:hypothetical protein